MGTYGIQGWFPDGRDSWRLDAITLLAIIGESAIEAHSQAIEASSLCLIPRLLPAPQALLKPSRPLRMPDYPAVVSGVYSGVVLRTVGFFANIITPLDDLPAFGFKVIHVRHKKAGARSVVETAAEVIHHKDGPGGSSRPEDLRRRRRRAGRATSEGRRPHASTRSAYDSGPRLEHGRPRHISKEAEGTNTTEDDTATSTTEERETIPPRWDSPVTIISALSFILTAVIIGMMVYWRDGVALIAVGTISLGTSIVGYASWWHPILLVRGPRAGAGDVVIQTQQGGFILVRCTDAVARELYAGTPECRYRVGDKTHKLLMAAGTALLMVAIILLGNVGFEGQTMVGLSYFALNMAYWLASMAPGVWFWDLGARYEWEDVTPADARRANSTTDAGDRWDGYKSFTRTLWFVIRETGDTRWARRSGAAPGTERWRAWLREAEENARAGNRRWAAVRRKDDIFADEEEGEFDDGVGG